MNRLCTQTLSLLFLIVWLVPGSAHAQVVIALEGEAAPGTGGGSFQFFSEQPVINDLGHVAFESSISGGTSAYGVFLDAGHGLVAVAVAGQVAPGTGGGTFGIVGEPALNASGDLVFAATVSNSTAGVGTGLFLYSGGVLSAVATNLDMAPGTNGGLYAAFGPRLSLNDSGEVAFHGDVSGAGNTSSGIFVEGGGSSRAVFLRGGSTPAALPGTYFSLSDPAINAAGNVVALAGIDPSEGAFTTAVVVESGGVDEIAALIGDPAPGTGAGTYSEFNFAATPGIDTSGQVFFHSRVSGGTATQGLFVDSMTTQAAVVLPGQAAPDSGGLNYFSFSISKLTANDAGAVGFSSILSPSGMQGLFVGPSGEFAQLIAKAGDAVPDTGGGSYLILPSNPSINSAGGAAFFALLTGGTAATAIIAVPEPAPVVSALIALAALARAARRSNRLRTQS